MAIKSFTTREELRVETWQLPRLDGKVVNEPVPEQTVEPEPEEVQPPSAAELQAIRDAAREEGYNEGVSQGHAAGVEQGHEEGFQEGFEAGKAAGEQAGREAADAQATKELAAAKADFAQRFSSVINQLNAVEASLEEELTPVIRDLVLRIAQSLVVQSLRQTPEQIEQIVHQAIQLMPATHERMDINLHPDDLAILKTLDRPWLEHVALHADTTLSPGGCVIKTRHSLLDYSLQARYEQQIAALLDVDSERPPEALRTLSAERFKALSEPEMIAEAETAQSEPVEPATDVDGEMDTEHLAEYEAADHPTVTPSEPNDDVNSQDDDSHEQP